ncbi:uncharacterized protein LOC142889277 [Nelusetta ayraudi]|uniref:uncharacterized protein LOC142889277 n=1 Tax=Nelusetta ayraudi TaxID=303726 RepID=UPI003F6EFA89
MLSCQRCKRPGSGDFESPHLEKLLPEGYDHRVCTYEDIGEGQFKAKIKLRITSEEEVHKWLEDFQTSSLVTWRKSKTYPQHTGCHNAYRVDLRCEHNTYPKTVAKKTKNTSCCATMYLVLKRKIHSKNRTSRSLDPHIKDGFLFNISLRHEHNHPLFCAEALRKRDVSSATTADEGDSEEGVMDEVPPTSRPDASGTSAGEDLEAGWQWFCSSITKKLKDDPQTFTAPVRTFLETYRKMNDSSIASALHFFGKVSQVKATQPTAIAGRKSALGERRALIPGPPPKFLRKEHQYSKENCKKSASHSLADCVEDNACLGGHH